MDNPEDGFLLAIHERPNGHDLKLIYADWLEERGHPGDERLAAAMRLWADIGNPYLELDERFRLEDLCGNLQEALDIFRSKVTSARERRYRPVDGLPGFAVKAIHVAKKTGRTYENVGTNLESKWAELKREWAEVEPQETLNS